MTWIDNTVVTIIVIGGIFILYRGLKEPIDLFFGLLAKGFVAARDKIQSSRAAGGGEYYETIRYG